MGGAARALRGIGPRLEPAANPERDLEPHLGREYRAFASGF